MATNFLHAPRYAHIVGWGKALPERVLTNADLEAIVDTSDVWIRERTGIRERRIAGEHDTTVSLGFAAARQALEVADVLPAEIDLIIVATSTPEHIFPSSASLIQDALGASAAGAFDLSAACTGFIYALSMAAQAIISGSITTALVIGSETMSRLVNWQDRGTCILFGDGAGAVVLRASDIPGGILASVLHSDGSGRDLLNAPLVGSPDPGLRGNGEVAPFKMTMNGQEVFRFATRVIRESVLEVLEKAGLTLADVDWVIPHQANERIITRAAKSLDLPIERFIMNLDQYGNTSAASIPIAMAEAAERGDLKPNDTVVLVAFGAGLAWGATALTWGVTPPPEQARLNRYRREMAYFLARQRSNLVRTLRRLLWLVQLSPLRDILRRLDHEEQPPIGGNDRGSAH
ncbi:MAG: ketoacyl-ACP synthase III [Anaerolineae bacterium]|nr:ketoacyl-ACP synthase III [Anaerolineae bacterium]